MIKGVLFDMDGVLVDSEAFICKAAILMFHEFNIEAKEIDFLPFVGMGENRYIGGVAQKYGLNTNIDDLKNRTYSIYGEIVKGKLKALDGVFQFIEKCKKQGLKLAVATSADEIKMNINLQEINLPKETFDATVNGLEVERKKPFPDIFILAAKKLNIKPEECLVVEDAISGVKAAKAASCKCLALTSSFAKNELQEADWVSNTLADAPDAAIAW